ALGHRAVLTPPPQLLLELLDQSCDALSGGGRRLGLRLRCAGGAVDAVSRGFLARVARTSPERGAAGAGQTTDRVARRVAGGGTRPVRRRAAAFGRPHLAA